MLIRPSLRWEGERLVEARIELPDRRVAVVRPASTEHPLLGPCDAVTIEPDPRIVARIAAVDWAVPRSIPALDVPGALPGGAGTAILDLLAVRAREAGVATLRYRGPYPTASLFDALLGSFRTVAAPADALARFTRDVESLAFRGEIVEVPVDFVPAPHTWTRKGPRVVVQSRDGIERVWIDGKPFDRDRAVARRLRVEDDRVVAHLVIAGSPLVDVLALDASGTPLGEPAPLPPAPGDTIGLSLPDELAVVLRELVAARAPSWARDRVREVLAAPFVFADTRDEPAKVTAAAIEVHTLVAERALDLDAAELLAILVDAVEPAVLRAAARSVVTD